ncbi:unnamed protein product [Musa hybrid cultivar]
MAMSSKKYYATNPLIPCQRRVRQMDKGDLMSMFSRQFMGMVLRSWIQEEDKLFEWALVVYPKVTPDQWSTIAAQFVETWECY